MRIDLPIAWTIGLNVGGWLAIQLGLAWAFTRMPVSWFSPGRVFSWERGGRVYERLFGIKRWKSLLPDGASWFSGGFAKSSLGGTGAAYWERFSRETWRGELCHWCAIACTPLFFLWNPWWGDLVIVAYALAANLPCILTQRYNRCRLIRLRQRSTA